VNKKTIKDVDLKGKKVFVRVDFNVPMDENQNITNDKRIVATLPTINYLLEQGAAVILACHVGRPTEAREPKFSTKPIAKRLGELLGKEVKWAEDCIGEPAEKAAAALQPGEVLLLENLRYHKEEKKNKPAFAKKLAALADIAVDDAFGVSHRAHASNVGITHFLETVSGFLMEKEINFIGKTLEAPQRPFVAIIGGAKVSDKIGVISNLIDKVDTIIIGGGMAHTFDAAKGLEVGKSLCERDKIELAKGLLEKAEAKGVKVVLPIDIVVADKFAADAEFKTVPVDQCPPDWQGLDSGEKTSQEYVKALEGAKTIIWNGPMGVFEFDNFAKGTLAVAKAVADATEKGAISIVGGGDSIAALKKTGLSDKISHISTGGGATLEYLEGKCLPGIDAIATEGRMPIIAGNWKMNNTIKDGEKLVGELIPLVAAAQCRVVVCPTATALDAVAKAVKGTNIHVGAQNVHWEKSGAYTGEISTDMLNEINVDFVVLGHSERRDYFGETDEGVNKRAKAAFNAGITPIICCGESLEIREAGNYIEHVVNQINAALEGFTAKEVAKLVIAYEPIWAIGTGKTATFEQAEEVCKAIREAVAAKFGQEAADAIRIQYGGSVKPATIKDLMKQPNVDGALVGGASLKAPDFAAIVNF
jgi:triosephosphate isomerase